MVVGPEAYGSWERCARSSLKYLLKQITPPPKKKRVEPLSRQELFEDQVPVFLRVQFHEKAS